ncbi:MAG: DMT family transporter [Rhizobiales bacterium]|nr:DMT family transporter [Hyphomicrobiales bacterium]
MAYQPDFLGTILSTLKEKQQPLISWWLDKPGNLRGAIWMLLASAFFSVSVLLVKQLGQHLGVTQILLVRQFIMFLIIAPALLNGFPGILKTNHLNFHMIRIMLALVAMLAGFSSVIHIPLADATAISFAKSFFVTIFAIIFLKETVGPRRWVATIAGFVGVVIMISPGAGGSDLDIWAIGAVVSACCASLVMILLRYISRFDRPITLLSYQAIFVGLLMLPPGLYYWVQPTFDEWIMLLFTGLTAFAGQLFNIRAFRVGEATAITSIDYTRLIYSTIFGIFIFNEWPSNATFIGAGIIISASMYTVWREARLGKQLARSAEGRGYHN